VLSRNESEVTSTTIVEQFFLPNNLLSTHIVVTRSKRERKRKSESRREKREREGVSE